MMQTLIRYSCGLQVQKYWKDVLYILIGITGSFGMLLTIFAIFEIGIRTDPVKTKDGLSASGHTVQINEMFLAGIVLMFIFIVLCIIMERVKTREAVLWVSNAQVEVVPSSVAVIEMEKPPDYDMVVTPPPRYSRLFSFPSLSEAVTAVRRGSASQSLDESAPVQPLCQEGPGSYGVVNPGELHKD